MGQLSLRVGFNSAFANSRFQRDLFSQLMIHSAMKSGKKRNQKLGRCGQIPAVAAVCGSLYPPGVSPPTVQPDSLLTRLAFQLVATDTHSPPGPVFNPGRCLLVERDTMRSDSPLTQRLMRKALVLHD